ncbi:MAG: hypothetical protein ACE5GX_07070 [Thermoanaerobaculia bacterium]
MLALKGKRFCDPSIQSPLDNLSHPVLVGLEVGKAPAAAQHQGLDEARLTRSCPFSATPFSCDSPTLMRVERRA